MYFWVCPLVPKVPSCDQESGVLETVAVSPIDVTYTYMMMVPMLQKMLRMFLQPFGVEG